MVAVTLLIAPEYRQELPASNLAIRCQTPINDPSPSQRGAQRVPTRLYRRHRRDWEDAELQRCSIRIAAWHYDRSHNRG